MIAIDFEPMRPVKTNVYTCDKLFHLEQLEDLVEDENEEVYGFVIMDGNGALLGSLQGASRKVLRKFSVDLPKKHGRGGQSALRFARLRLEKLHNYVRKVGELCSQTFLDLQFHGSCPNVKGIILAGSAGLKDDLLKSNHFDKRLRSIVLRSFDLCYGGSRGFEQAIMMSVETIGSARLVRETRLLERFMDEVGRASGKVCFGFDETIQALEMGAVEHLLVCEDLDASRCTFRNTGTGEETIVHLCEEQEQTNQGVGKSGARLEMVEKESLMDWICEHHKEFGCSLEIVSNRSGVGHQFQCGFGGLGGTLRWEVEFYERGVDSPVAGEEEADDDSVGHVFDEDDYAF
mmetsp:Transcript_16694/g.24743  ORF Transcript_16694/g.24743 Transcript_16694/m.24743 type:complete len:347 (-) Transcript_16694:58-1098(-)